MPVHNIGEGSEPQGSVTRRVSALLEKKLTRKKRIKCFQTGDRVKAEVTQGKKTGSYVGRVAVRASGSFNIQTAQGVIQGISYRHCQVIQRADGYGYSQLSTSKKEAELRSARYPSQP